jgi:hypothetical protein
MSDILEQFPLLTEHEELSALGLVPCAALRAACEEWVHQSVEVASHLSRST